MAKESKGGSRGLSSLLGGVSDLVEKLEKLAESGGELSRSGSIPSQEPSKDPDGGESAKKSARGVYGFSVKLGVGGKDFSVEPFGNLRRDRSSGQPVVEDEIREPLVDVFDEQDRLLIVAEMPGVEPEDVHVDLSDHTLTLSAERGERRYRKAIEVAPDLERGHVEVSYKNGITEISCAKTRG